MRSGERMFHGLRFLKKSLLFWGHSNPSAVLLPLFSVVTFLPLLLLLLLFSVVVIVVGVVGWGCCGFFFGGGGSLKIKALSTTSKLDLCEEGSFSPTIFNSDIELSVFPISCFFLICCRFVEGNVLYAENVHIMLFCPVDIKKRSFQVNLLCVLICFLER